MNKEYFKLSQQAVIYEKLGNFLAAAELWAKAAKVAYGNNVVWAEVRAEFCHKTTLRNEIKAPEEV